MIHLKKILPNKLILLIFLFLISCNYKIEVDLIIHNGILYSLDDNNNIHEAIAIKNNKIIATGKNNQILNKFQSIKKMDLKGKAMYPGFIDAHCHFLAYGLQTEMVDLSSAKSFNEIIETLKKSDKTERKKWLIGYGWDQNQWKEKEWPNNKLLNVNFSNTNVVIYRIDGHALMANRTAIKNSKINFDTIIEGGHIEKINNEFTGIFIDNAMDLIVENIPKPNDISKKRALIKAQEDCFSLGLTTVDIAGLNKEDVDLIDRLQKTNELKIKVYAMLSDNQENFDYFIDSVGTPLKTE